MSSSETNGGGSPKRALPPVKTIVFLLLVMLLAALAVKNMQVVTVSYYDYKFQSRELQTPLLFVIAASLGAGFLLAWFFGFIAQMKLKSQLRKQTRTILSMTEELQKLKSPPKSETVKTND
ncbi:MAG: LapA family protein [Nitrospinae bacterium]|nr:LapA family protein [Nitrospinota bacterium]